MAWQADTSRVATAVPGNKGICQPTRSRSSSAAVCGSSMAGADVFAVLGHQRLDRHFHRCWC